MLESPSTYYYDEMDNDVSKSTVLEPTIKHLMKETILGHWSACNLVSIGGIYKTRNIPNSKTIPEINESLLKI